MVAAWDEEAADGAAAALDDRENAVQRGKPKTRRRAKPNARRGV